MISKTQNISCSTQGIKHCSSHAMKYLTLDSKCNHNKLPIIWLMAGSSETYWYSKSICKINNTSKAVILNLFHAMVHFSFRNT